jgi:hypothetical protein
MAIPEIPRIKTQKIQAKHIPEQALIDLIDRLYNVPRLFYRLNYNGVDLGVSYSNAAHFSDICKAWDNIPPKVIATKLQKLEEAGKIMEGGSNCYRVVHKHELPIHRWFNKYTESWVEVPMTHKEYRQYRFGH